MEKANTINQLRKCNSEIFTDELYESIKLIEKHIQKWYKNYLEKKNNKITEFSEYQI